MNRRRFIYSAASGLMVPVTLKASTPIPFSFFKGASSVGAGCSAAATTALNDWVARVQGQGSDVTIAGTQAAVCAYIDGLMTDGVWSKITRHSINAGDGLLALNSPLKNGGTPTDTLVNFDAGDYSQSTGLTGNGVDEYIQTGLAGDAIVGGENDVHLAVYCRTTDNTGLSIGAFQLPQKSTALYPSAYNFSVWDSNDYVSGRVQVADSTNVGMFVGSRTSSSLSTLYHNGTILGTNTNAGGGRPTSKFYVHCQNGNQYFTARTIEMWSIGLGLTASDVANLGTRYATLRSALGR